MLDPMLDQTLDTLLALRLTVAWAGEGRCQPRRFGWWDTDAIDEAGGGDFFARLAPRTHRWASLEAALEAARRVDAEGRRRLGNADLLRTVFFLGFDLDERLADRLAELRRQDVSPDEALPLLCTLGAVFERERVLQLLQLPEDRRPAYAVVPGGRELKGPPPASPDELVRNLVSALAPAPEQYPLPFYRVKA